MNPPVDSTATATDGTRLYTPPAALAKTAHVSGMDAYRRLCADQQPGRDLGQRCDGKRGHRKPFAFIAFRTAGPRPADDGDGVFEEAGPVLDAPTEAAEFEIPVAEPDTEFEPVAGQQRQGGGVFGQADGVVQAGDDDVGADPHGGGSCREHGGHYQR